MREKTLEVQEHHLKLQADPLTLKIISEAVGNYMDTHELTEYKQTLSDFRFNMEKVYQRWYALDQDDWGYTEEHKEELAIHD